MEKICPVCKKKGTTSFKIEFTTCDKHTQKDVFKLILENKL